MASTAPLRVVEPLTALHDEPSHWARWTARALPPASVNAPPAYKMPGLLLSRALTGLLRAEPPDAPPFPRWSQPPGPSAIAAGAKGTTMATVTMRASSRRRMAVPLGGGAVRDPGCPPRRSSPPNTSQQRGAPHPVTLRARTTGPAEAEGVKSVLSVTGRST